MIRLPVLGTITCLFLLVITFEVKFIQGAQLVKQMRSENDWHLVLDNFRTSARIKMHSEEHLFHFSNIVWKTWTSLNAEEKQLTKQLFGQEADVLLTNDSPHWRSILSLGYAYLRIAVEYPEVYPKLINIKSLLEEKAPNLEDTHRFVALYFMAQRDFLRAKATVVRYLKLNPRSQGFKAMLTRIDESIDLERDSMQK